VTTWKSPCYSCGDDDRIVNFRQTIDMRNRLLAKGVRSKAVLPDDEHDSLSAALEGFDYHDGELKGN
jgi:hypothetical protein